MNEREIVWKTFGQTVIHPVAFGFTVAMGIALLLLRRQRAAVPLVLVASFLPVEQRIVVGGLDFDMIRLMILFGWTRLLLRGEAKDLRPLGRVDWIFIAWMASGSLFYVLRELDLSAVIYRCGVMFDAFGMFFLFRALVRDEQDVRRVAAALAWMCVVTGGFMTVEKLTGRNFFSVLGGVEPFSIVRDGMIRAQGSFSHPIMAGTFGATTLPLIIGLAWDRKAYVTVGAGVAGAVLVTLAASSSGAVMALMVAIVGLALWPFREQMRSIRWGIVVVLLILHNIREKPVWHLIGRLSDLMGGDGYHRVALIDGFLGHWSSWILRGTDSTAEWGWGLQDLTNQFVYEGVQGGLVTLIIFIALLVYAFANVAIGMRRARRRRGISRDVRTRGEFFAWCLGCSLAAHLMVWISVSYFGQMTVLLYALFAMIASLSSPAFFPQAVPVPARALPAPPATPIETAATESRPSPALAAPPEPEPPDPSTPSLGKGLLQRGS